LAFRVYISAIAPGWPPDRQERVLDEKLPGWRGGTVFQDIEFTVRQKRSRDPALLYDRATAFRVTTRSTRQTLHVAALPCIAWNAADFQGNVLPGLRASKQDLTAVDTGFTVRPSGNEDALAEFQARRKLGSQEASRLVGAVVSANNRKMKALEACEKIKDRWEQPTKLYPTVKLLKEARVSLNTAKKHLDPRPRAQRIYQAEQKRAAKRAAKKEQQ
jgi:hypothetical protein